ncbi:MAG: hypothetical protein DKM50_05405 [Candidatus Margulisiibacteriota bacterium]|nr:MAG: hypothetical protein A2X43_00890 [Candidatus Margulisbacteria bacterium GWD2_39_127]OGI02387.1 MAG: hypothetical protein A2X42_09540 [Candidatus Margulisbacteria bacterium GWF2_38_17]OGI08520.1 MAG: hypothetical protein A2X41_07330 [Candidatus Margulisbacteria bacterium GWE2_39_32]PZM81813.1 MAG: hypothetical protein DKM50_05405 [Candidatus Margulisiibacteriota bacterium]HAR63429.1 hypothetical protein [Candidatus Margulisiibacteriota bacterium]
MLDKDTINNVVQQLKQFNPEQILISTKKTLNNPDITVMIKKDQKEYVVENELTEINSDISLIAVEDFITNAAKRSSALVDLYTSATTIYPSS